MARAGSVPSVGWRKAAELPCDFVSLRRMAAKAFFRVFAHPTPTDSSRQTRSCVIGWFCLAGDDVDLGE